jgi:hypothetical protein
MCNKFSEATSIYYLLIGCSVPSVLGCFLITFIYYYFKDLRGLSLRIVLYIAINDGIRSILYFVPVDRLHDDAFCKAFGYIFSTTFVSNAAWAMCIAVTLYMSNVKYRENYEYYHKIFFILSYVLIPIIQALPFITDSIGYNDGICTVINTKEGQLWRIATDYVPMISLNSACFFIYLRIYYVFKHLGVLHINEIMLEKGMIYPVIMCVVITPLLVLRVLELFYSSCQLFELAIISYGLLALHGFFNTLALLANRNIRRHIREEWERRRNDSEEINIVTGIIKGKNQTRSSFLTA